MTTSSHRSPFAILGLAACGALLAGCAAAPSPAGLYHLDRDLTKQTILETERGLRDSVDETSVEMRLHDDGNVTVWSQRPGRRQQVSEGTWEFSGETVSLAVREPDDTQRTINAEYGGERLLIEDEVDGKPYTLVLVREEDANESKGDR